jgi:branched-chain amino acid transport system ATP-binding protein
MLEVQDAVVHYGEAIALQGVSLAMDSGEFVCLLGPNGAGKTTLLMAISGVVRMTSGQVRFLGETLTNLSPSQIQRKGIVQVPEGRRIFPSLTVWENLRVGAYSRSNETEIRSDLERFSEMFPALRERRRQKGGSLSGGEQQIVAIVRGLMSRPKLLLLDEPSLGLAPLFIKTVYGMIKEIHKQGNAILLVEQSAKMALEASARAYILDIGNVVVSGLSKEIATRDEVRKAYLGE